VTSQISHTTFDCRNAYELSEWWKPVLGYADVPGDPNLPGHVECMIIDPAGSGPRLLFIEVPEPKTVKNRGHLDLRPVDLTREEEVDRLMAHGATLVGDHRDVHGPGTGWVTLADPEGNEFCILRSQAEVSAPATP
jgi:hypothetical protein